MRSGRSGALEAFYRSYLALCNALQHLLVDEPWMCAHLLDSGTHRGLFHGVAATGREVSTQEFAVYRVEEQLIAEVWVTADNLTLLRQLS